MIHRERFVVLFAGALFGGCAPADEKDECVSEPGTVCRFAGTEIAGGGAAGLPARATELYLPQDVGFGADGTPYIVDWNNHVIRALHDGVLENVIGTGYIGDAMGGAGTEQPLNHPTHITPAPNGRLIVAAWHNSKVLEFDPASGAITPLCGTGKRAFSGDGGPANVAELDLPVATAFAPDGRMFIGDQANQRIRVVGTDGNIATFAGIGTAGFSGDGGPATAAELRLPGGQSAPPAGRLAADAAGNVFFTDSANHRIRRIDSEGVITTFAGNGNPTHGGDGGPAVDASLSRPSDVEVGPDGSVYVADTDNQCIRRIDPTGVIDTVLGRCGTPGRGEDGDAPDDFLLDRPYGVTLDGEGNLFVADTHNHRIVVLWAG